MYALAPSGDKARRTVYVEPKIKLGKWAGKLLLSILSHWSSVCTNVPQRLCSISLFKNKSYDRYEKIIMIKVSVNINVIEGKKFLI